MSNAEPIAEDTITMNRYHVVVVSKYIGMYGKNSPTAYAVADHEQANSIVSNKYDRREDAQKDTDRLNSGSAATHVDVRRNLLGV